MLPYTRSGSQGRHASRAHFFLVELTWKGRGPGGRKDCGAEDLGKRNCLCGDGRPQDLGCELRPCLTFQPLDLGAQSGAARGCRVPVTPAAWCWPWSVVSAGFPPWPTSADWWRCLQCWVEKGLGLSVGSLGWGLGLTWDVFQGHRVQ